MTPWALIPLPWRIGGLLVLLALVGGYHLLAVHQADAAGFRRGSAEVQGRWDAERVRLYAVAASAAAAARAEETRRSLAQAAIEEAHAKELVRLRSDAAVADAAADRLRERVAALIAAARRDSTGADPAAVSAGPAACPEADLLAVVLGRAVEAAGQLAAAADESRAAGAACVAEYDALTPELVRADPPNLTR